MLRPDGHLSGAGTTPAPLKIASLLAVMRNHPPLQGQLDTMKP